MTTSGREIARATVTMLRPLTRGRLVAQGLGSSWLWFPFAVGFIVVVLFELDTTLWDRRRAADVRKQVAGSMLVDGVRLNRTQWNGWVRFAVRVAARCHRTGAR